MIVSLVCGTFLTQAAAGCAPTLAAPPAVHGEPAVSSRTAVAAASPRPPPKPEARLERDLSAASLLERGFAYFRDDRVALAGDAFRAAIATGNLNDAGRALAYWHVYLAERRQGRVETGADALWSFVAVGEDLLDGGGDPPSLRVGDDDFTLRFDLVRRVARARAILSAIWADRRPDFGRSVGMPVPVHSDTEVDYFLELAPPCGDAPDRQILRAAASRTEESGIERASVLCHERRRGVEYYFERTAAADPR